MAKEVEKKVSTKATTRRKKETAVTETSDPADSKTKEPVTKSAVKKGGRKVNSNENNDENIKNAATKPKRGRKATPAPEQGKEEMETAASSKRPVRSTKPKLIEAVGDAAEVLEEKPKRGKKAEEKVPVKKDAVVVEKKTTKRVAKSKSAKVEDNVEVLQEEPIAKAEGRKTRAVSAAKDIQKKRTSTKEETTTVVAKRTKKTARQAEIEKQDIAQENGITPTVAKRK